ncbi:hypothetical protein KKB83_00775 [Patescibacteria group bacterium]|nr:hypothetical protein [Patescibacteria group bacterium]
MTFRNSFFSQFNNFPYFTKQALSLSASNFEMKPALLNSYVAKALKKGELISLKRGCYVTRIFYEENKVDSSYIFFLANNLLIPSYVSLESALQYYGLLAEALNTFRTSITTKLPREYENSLGIYSYRSISDDLFSGFCTIKGSFEFTIAEPHKAVFDYLYYQTDRFTCSFSENILASLRIDVESLAKKEKEKLKRLISKFTARNITL